MGWLEEIWEVLNVMLATLFTYILQVHHSDLTGYRRFDILPGKLLRCPDLVSLIVYGPCPEKRCPFKILSHLLNSPEPSHVSSDRLEDAGVRL